MYSCLCAFLTKYKLLFKKKFGFTNNHYTSHVLIDLITKYLDNNYFVCGAFVDLQKAFNTVKQEIVLVKLDFYGIGGLANSWLKSFLKNRKQYVNLPRHSSSVKTVTHIVPRGSALGPLLFLYINDLQVSFQNQLFTILQMTSTFYLLAKKFGTIESVINHE